jgi:hypothetical protein
MAKLSDLLNNVVNSATNAGNQVVNNTSSTLKKIENLFEPTNKSLVSQAIKNNLSKVDTIDRSTSVIKKTNSNQTTTIKGIENMLRMQGIVTDFMYDKYQRFKRYPLIDLSEDILRFSKEYIFITKPELNIYSDSLGTQLNEQFKLLPMFADIQARYPMILRQLQFDLSLHESPFINLLSYTVQNTIDISDTNAKEVYTAANIIGAKINYRGSSEESDQDVSFTLEFRENSIAEVYTFFRLWDQYENLKQRGVVKPPSAEYTQKRILHDKVAAYKFIVDEVGSLIFWSKFYGVIPDGAPRSSWSETSDNITHSVSFKADFVEDMDPQILVDFNELVEPFKSKCKWSENGGWVEDDDRQNYEPQTVPFIVKNKNDYQLKWVGGVV